MNNYNSEKEIKEFQTEIVDYDSFVEVNQKKVNLMLNKFLRVSILVGPMLMVAIKLGIFHSVSYATCIIVSVLLLLLSGIHYYLVQHSKKNMYAPVIAFLALDVLLVLMNSAHIGIYITWFVVPLISLLYSDFKIYGIAVVINYLMMMLSVWIVSPYYAGLRVDFEKPIQYFLERISGFSIETVVMVIAGYSICRISTAYYRDLIEKYQLLKENKEQIDEQKNREKQLLQISRTDELTHLFNRRCYYEDIDFYQGRELEQGFVVFSADLNGLKEVNDSKGHVAGDELLTAVSECLSEVINPIGKAYRIGGDEFLAIANTDNPVKIVDEIMRRSSLWKGKYVEHLSISIGYAAHDAHPKANIDELVVLADQMMYQAKERYYSTPGIDRRRSHKSG